MANTRKMLDTAMALGLVTFKDRASGLWVIRDRVAARDLAHEGNRRDALQALRVKIAERAA